MGRKTDWALKCGALMQGFALVGVTLTYFQAKFTLDAGLEERFSSEVALHRGLYELFRAGKAPFLGPVLCIDVAKAAKATAEAYRATLVPEAAE